ncbi:MAG: hypothetical protein H6R07_1772 [Proteobacteria bacterium]|nr:hypothetical protein [Pseudomonadota bacterium]
MPMFAHLLGGLSLVCIWSTTALAIKWGVTGIDYSVSLLVRFSLAFLAMLPLLIVGRCKLPPWRRAWPAWLAAGGGTAISMICTYWASQYLNSGLVAVIHGLTPLATAIFARIWLDEHIARNELIGIVLAICGLVFIFSGRLSLRPDGIPALLAVLAAMSVNSAGMVKLKGYSQGLDTVVISTGSMAVGTVISGALWLAYGMPVPEAIPLRTLGAIFYLALFGSVVAMSLYFWLIRECRPTQIALIPMISTVSALWLGNFLNNEVLTRNILIGSGLILAGLALHQLGTLRTK